MDIFEIVSHIEQTGYCVVENVIPVNEVDAICKKIITVQQAYHQQAETELAKTRARGHQVGVRGVGVLKQVINVTAVLCHIPSRRSDPRCSGIIFRSICADFLY